MRNPQITAEQREKALLAAGFAGRDEAICELRFGGQKVTNELRDELLKKIANNEYVELELDVIAYEQKDGVDNRNYVRVADSAMAKLASTSIGKPFLRDHEQRNSMAVAGKIIAAKHTALSDGTNQIMQTVKLTAPWAVDLVLRQLMSTVSISWRATDKVMCSACKTPVFTDCYHWPGDRVKQTVVEGKVYFVRNRKDGDITINWIYNGVEALETSPTPVPAVPTARIDGIRAAMGADDDEVLPDQPAPENTNMSELETLKAQLTRMTQISELSDSHKAYFRRLGSAEQDAFLAKSAADRTELLKPIYTAKNGNVFTAADDPKYIQLAKDMDEQQKRFDETLAAEKSKNLVARATTELAHLSGTVEQRAALLGAIESISDADTRTAVLAAVKEYDQKASVNFQRTGKTGAGSPVTLDVESKIEALVQKRMDASTDEELTYEQAYTQVMESKEGQALYAQMPTARERQN